jgi:preprotein translocase subunit YajC
MFSAINLNTYLGATLLQAGGQPQQPSMIGSLLPIILIVVVMYFLMIRPQRKRQKMHQEMVSGLKSGDEVVTSGGLYGTVSGVDDKGPTIYVKIANEVKVKLDRSSIARVIDKTAEAS